MADSGFLVNFDITPADTAGAVPRTNAIRGGRWKDRFKAKKRLQHSKHGIASGSRDHDLRLTSTSRDLHFIDLPGSAGSPNELNGSIWKTSAGTSNSIKGDRQIISSIFSSNPKPAEKGLPLDTDGTTDVEPTNAPLKDGTAFATMGLLPTLASHLVDTLGFKNPTAIQKQAVPQLLVTDSDAFIQAETGSGKTLAYLLPVVQRILSASKSGDRLHRNSGCFAIVLAPTRELGRQIHSVLLQILSHPSLHWLVPVLMLGGEKKKSEKARIRKGGNIMVATPGRLADHLLNTEAFDVGDVRWLVLDEGDRLTDLGFEDTIQQIVEALNKRSSCHQAPNLAHPRLNLPQRRITILCSATMKLGVQRLGDFCLTDALFLKSEQSEEQLMDSSSNVYKAPAQLKQAYIVAPAKLRLVGLVSVLRRAFIRQVENMKVIVFFSCADSVDFHYEALSWLPEDTGPAQQDTSQEPKENERHETDSRSFSAKTPASLIDPAIWLFKLHGSLSQQIRTSTLLQFFNEKKASILLCTDVASRGLDLPNVDLVVQYDPPFGKEDYIHRIGRTARAGRNGRALIFLLPGPEEQYPKVVLGDYALTGTSIGDVLKKGFSSAHRYEGENWEEHGPSNAGRRSGKRNLLEHTDAEDWEKKATDCHLDVEHWVLSSAKREELAKRAFQSHIRAYSTHIATERTIFDIKQIHLGHLAKSFGLRQRPGDIQVRARDNRLASHSDSGNKKRSLGPIDNWDVKTLGEEGETEAQISSKKMRKKMKEHMNSAAEFNIG